MPTSIEIKYRKLQLYAAAYECLKTIPLNGEAGTLYAEAKQWLETNVDELIRTIQEVVLSLVYATAKKAGKEEPEVKHAKWVSQVMKIDGVPENIRSAYTQVYKGLMKVYFYETSLEDKIKEMLQALVFFKTEKEVLRNHLEKFGFTDSMLDHLMSSITPPAGADKLEFSKWAISKARNLVETTKIRIKED